MIQGSYRRSGTFRSRWFSWSIRLSFYYYYYLLYTNYHSINTHMRASVYICDTDYIYLGTSYRIERPLFFTSKKTRHWNRWLASIDTRWCKWFTCSYTTHEFSGILQCSCADSTSDGTETITWIFISRFSDSRHGSSSVTGECLFNKIKGIKECIIIYKNFNFNIYINIFLCK